MDVQNVGRLAEAKGLGIGRIGARFDLGDVEDGIHQVEKVIARVPNDFEMLALARIGKAAMHLA